MLLLTSHFPLRKEASDVYICFSISNTISGKPPLGVFGHPVNMSAYLQEIVQSYRYIAIMFSEHTRAGGDVV